MSDSSGLSVIDVDYADPAQAAELLALLDDYARDPAGGGEPLAAEVKTRLIDALATVPNAFSLLVYHDFGGSEQRAIGFANCFIGFSTFYARPLLNIHDLAVDTNWRGQGVAKHLLSEIERRAAERGCCKITLEVLDGNHAARAAYRKSGFAHYQLDPKMGSALMMQKMLSAG